MDKNSLAHTKWNCKYHIVFTPKYRRQAIYGKIKKDIKKLEDTKIEKDLATFLAKNCEYVDNKEQKDFDKIIDDLKSDEDEGREINLNEIL